MTDADIIIKAFRYIAFYYEYGIENEEISEFGNKYLGTWTSIHRLEKLIEDKIK